MQLFFIDQLTTYCEQLIQEIIVLKDNTINMNRIISFEELEKMNFNQNEPSLLLVDETFITTGGFAGWYCNKKIPFSILCEGVLSIDSVDLLNDLSIDRMYIDKYCINRYQSTTQIISQIRDNYMFQGEYVNIDKHEKTSVISLFTPYGNSQFSQSLESYVKKYSHLTKSTLLIHYDPYYQNLDSNPYNLSYLFSQIKRKPRSISWLVEEIIRINKADVPSLTGPSHMLDIDYLDEDSMNCFLEWLENGTKYERIFLNFNGVHISKHVDKLLNISSKCALLSNSESIQRLILSQFPYKWHLQNGEVENLIKEMMV